MINSLGGIQVLFPLLEIVSRLPPVTDDDVIDLQSSSSGTSQGGGGVGASASTSHGVVTPQSSVDSLSTQTDWDVVPSRKITGLCTSGLR